MPRIKTVAEKEFTRACNDFGFTLKRKLWDAGLNYAKVAKGTGIGYNTVRRLFIAPEESSIKTYIKVTEFIKQYGDSNGRRFFL